MTNNCREQYELLTRLLDDPAKHVVLMSNLMRMRLVVYWS